MKPLVIVGAAPIGLYLAYKLYKAGITEDIAIYDPRAGTYTRPGHVNKEIFAELDKRLNEHFWANQNRHGHIKEFERILFAEIQKLAIPTERKTFVRFNQDQQHKGIIVKDEQGEEEVIECQRAFDCTGSERALIKAVNSLISPPPFTIKPISTNIRAKHHLLAYVTISQTDIQRINTSNDRATKKLEVVSSKKYVLAMEQMRQLGWKEFGYPNLYGQVMGNNKACIYTECPDDLPKEAYALWLRTTINALTESTDIKFNIIPSTSRKWGHKPRLTCFEVDPVEVEEVLYQHPELPDIIPMGDAQIDPNYFLSHGILDGLDRVDAFIKSITVAKGKIKALYPATYRLLIASNLLEHKIKIRNHYNKRADYFDDALTVGQRHYEQGSKKGGVKDHCPKLKENMRELNARASYREAHLLWLSTVDEATNSFKLVMPKDLAPLFALSKVLLKAFTMLPETFQEKEQARKKLIKLAAISTEYAQQLMAKGDYQQAMAVYQHSLTLYQPLEEPTLQQQVVAVKMGLLQCYVKTEKAKEALELGESLLDELPDPPPKIVLNTLQAIQSLIINADADAKNRQDLNILKQKTLALLKRFKDKLPSLVIGNMLLVLVQHYNSKRPSLELAAALKEWANKLFTDGVALIPTALKLYQQALTIYQNPATGALEHRQILAIKSNMVLCYRKLNQLDNAYKLGSELLSAPGELDEYVDLYRKILFNTLQALRDLVNQEPNSSNMVRDLAIELLRRYPKVLEEKDQDQLVRFFNPDKAELDAKCRFFEAAPHKVTAAPGLTVTLGF